MTNRLVINLIVSIFIFLSMAAIWIIVWRMVKKWHALHVANLKLARELAGSTQEMLHLVLDTIPARVFWKDVNSTYLGCNTLFARDAGFDHPSDLIGRDDFDMGWKHEAERYRHDDRIVIENDRPLIGYEEPQTTPDGKQIWLRTSKVPLKRLDGEIIGLLGTYEDITSRKQLEHEYIIAREKAEQANKAKSRFLANMSHELRTPMHAILSFTNLGLKRADDKKLEHYLDNIRTSGIRLTSLLNDLLDLSKLEAGKMYAEFVELDLTKLIKNSESEIDSLLQDKGQSLKVDVEQSYLCMADNKLMTQVFINLFTNAIKFSPHNSVIEVIIRQFEDELADNQKEKIEVMIKDQGVGVPQDEVETIFNQFVQGSETKSKTEGTGLGLPICKEIIELHHGRIWVQSPPDGQQAGSAFFIQIPVYQDTAPGSQLDD